MRKKDKQLVMPPGPRGFGRVYRGLRGDTLSFLVGLREEFGDVAGFRLFGRRYVVVSHPELAKEVLLTQADAFWKGPGLQRSKGLFGEGLLTAEGEMHKGQRRVMQPAFHAKRVEGYVGEVVSSVRGVIEEWSGGAKVVDLRPAMMKLTLVIAGRALFGAMLEEEVELVGRSMEVLIGSFGRALVPWGRVLNVLPLPSTMRIKKAQGALMGLVGRMIGERRGEMGRGGGEVVAGCPMGRGALPDGRGTSAGVKEGRWDLLSAMIAATDPEGDGGGKGKLTDKQLRDQCVTILTAGHETTANGMTFTLWFLARYPEEQRLLREEVERVLGGREPMVEDLGKLERVRWVLAESMRLLPPVFAMGRENQREVELGGYRIAAKTTVLVSQWSMHRDGRFFEEPLEFRPERWREEKHPRYAYLPFSTGPRNCIGESFAWLEMMVALAMLVGRFEFSLEEGASGEMGVVPGITLRPKGRVGVRVGGLKS